MFKILLHLVYVFLELLKEGEHLYGLIVEGKNLLVLLKDGGLCDLANEAEVVLDAHE